MLPSWWQKKSPVPTVIIVCYRALLYITDRLTPALHLCRFLWVQKGGPSSTRPAHITQGSGLWCGFTQSIQTRAHNHTEWLGTGPILRSARYERIFLYIPLRYSPDCMLLSFRGGFICRGCLSVVVTSCVEGMHTAFHRVSLVDRGFWYKLETIGIIKDRAEGGERSHFSLRQE